MDIPLEPMITMGIYKYNYESQKISGRLSVSEIRKMEYKELETLLLTQLSTTEESKFAIKGLFALNYLETSTYFDAYRKTYKEIIGK